MTTCPACDHVHASDDARAVGRFDPAPTTYVAAHGGPPRATRTEAEADECAWRREQSARTEEET